MERIVWVAKLGVKEGWGVWHFREDQWMKANPLNPESIEGIQNVRITQFVPVNLLKEWGLEEGKAYRITVTEEVGHPYI